jgi:hypothetical protein
MVRGAGGDGADDEISPVVRWFAQVGLRSLGFRRWRAAVADTAMLSACDAITIPGEASCPEL